MCVQTAADCWGEQGQFFIRAELVWSNVVILSCMNTFSTLLNSSTNDSYQIWKQKLGTETARRRVLYTQLQLFKEDKKFLTITTSLCEHSSLQKR